MIITSNREPFYYLNNKRTASQNNTVRLCVPKTSAQPTFKGWNPLDILSERHIELLVGIIEKFEKREPKEMQKALPLATILTKLFPQNHFFHMIRGVINNELGKTDDAIADFTRAIEVKPKDSPNQAELALLFDTRAQLYLKNDEPEKAVDDIATSLAVAPEGFVSTPI